MKHLGDITKIKGCNAPVVDCIIGGSPCQDLSVAGKRAGLAGERSGLYMEQIRIIKEMRHRDEQHGRTGESIRPRYMVWENVPGAFSSNQGKDFAAVLEEAIRVTEPEAPDVPVPEKGWPTSGCFMGDHWSVAWRVLDAQFWGVPQRRRRIALVADFGGQSAPEILFIRKGVSRDLDESEQERKATARDAENRSRADDRTGAVGFPLGFRPENVRCYEEVATTLCNGTRPGFTTGVIQPVSIENHPADSRVDIDDSGKVQTLTSRMGTGGGNVPMVMEPVTSLQGSMIGRADHNGPQGDGVNEDVSFTLNTTDRHAVVYGISPYHSNCMKSDNPHSGYYEADTARTLDALQCGYPGCNQGGMAVVQPILDDQGGSQISVRYDGKCPTLRAESHGNLPCVMEPAYSIGNGQVNQSLTEEVAGALNCMHDQQAILQPVGTFQETGIGWWNDEDVGATLRALSGGDAMKANLVVAGVDCRNATEYEEQTGALQANACHNMNSNNVVRVRYIVRRLTPLECERLQGYPDGWTDIGEWVDSKGKKHKEADSPRYKALGNSIALPPWKWVLKRLCACYERDATMASLFDGIGGFPYIWEQINGKGSCLWASEIEEFPMAVTKMRFGGKK